LLCVYCTINWKLVSDCISVNMVRQLGSYIGLYSILNFNLNSLT
jgi:hypothetical protein